MNPIGRADTVDAVASELSLGGALAVLQRRFGSYELLDHWTQGEFHHDVVLRVPDPAAPIVIVATNCNGGVKEVLSFGELPGRGALWAWRCPSVPEFTGALPPLLGRAVTMHWFDPCELLAPDARSELKAEFRERQPGGGWVMSPSACGPKKR